MWWRGDGTRLSDCVFGDFDRRSVTDALRADGSTWSIATHGNGPWLFQRDDWVRAVDLRVADFTNDNTTMCSGLRATRGICGIPHDTS